MGIISLNKMNNGMNTQFDPRDLGRDGVTNAVNLDLRYPGKISKRRGVGTGSSYSGKTFSRMWRFVHDQLTGGSAWGYFETTGKKIYSEDTEIVTLSNATDINVIPFNDKLRFANGQSDDAGILQYISRKFFWSDDILYYPIMTVPNFSGSGLDDLTLDSGDTPTGKYSADYVVKIDATGTPDTFKWSNDGGATWEATGVSCSSSNTLENNIIIYWGATTGHTLNDQWTFSKKGNWHYDSSSPHQDSQFELDVSAESGGTMDLDSNTYYYKIVPVFDGNQESRLGDAQTVNTSQLSGTSKIVKLRITVGKNYQKNWNPRITSLNIYRSTSLGGVYRLVKIINTTENDNNLFFSSTAAHGMGAYVNNDTWETDEYAGKIMIAGGYKHTIVSNSENVAIMNAAAGSGESVWDEYWGIFDSVVTDGGTPACGPRFEIDDYTDWTLLTCSLTRTSVLPHSGTYSCKFTPSGGSGTADLDPITVPNGDYFVSIWVRNPNGGTIKLVAGGGSTTTIDTYSTVNNDWHLMSGSVSISTGQLFISIETTTGSIFYIDNLWAGIIALYIHTSGCYIGPDVTVDQSMLLTTGEDYYSGGYGIVGDSSSKNGDTADTMKVLHNVERAIQWDSDIGASYLSDTDGYLYFGLSDYLWKKQTSDTISVDMYDNNLLTTNTHPTLDTVLKVNYEGGIYLNGRLFVYNITLDPDGVNESHPNWIAFSEPLQPDVIPVTNIIAMEDIQGGDIIGLGEILGDLVVLMEHGIYRLRVPSSSPQDWERVEVAENIGCIAKNAIVNINGGIVFLGNEHVYLMDANFSPIPITQTIQGTYKGLSGKESSGAIYDPLNELLLFQFGGGLTTYVFDFRSFLSSGEEKWSADYYQNQITSFTINEDSVVYGINTGTSTTIWTMFQDLSSEELACSWSSGLIQLGPLSHASRVYRINMAYLSTVDDITVKLYDASGTSVLWTGIFPANTASTTYKTLRVGKRVRGHVKIAISTPITANDFEIYQLEIEHG